MDGRRGLVPIIFIQKLSGDELLEFNQRVLMGMREGDDSASTTIPQDIENITGIIAPLGLIIFNRSHFL